MKGAEEKGKQRGKGRRGEGLEDRTGQRQQEKERGL